MNRVEKEKVEKVSNEKNSKKKTEKVSFMKKEYVILFLIGIVPIFFFYELKLDDVLNLTFFLGMQIAYLLIFGYRFCKDRKYLPEIEETANFIKQNREAIRTDLTLLDENLKGKNAILCKTWNEYRKTLVEDGGKFYQTVELADYINEETFIYERINLRMLNYVSQVFVALGILGTFLGLVIGLGGLGDTGIFGQSETVVSQKMTQLLSGVTTSFYTSLYGIFYSILYSVLLNFYLADYQRKVSRLKEELLYTFAGNLLEESLERIKTGIENMDGKNDKIYDTLAMTFGDTMKDMAEISKSSLESIAEKITHIDKVLGDNNQKRDEQTSVILKEFKKLL